MRTAISVLIKNESKISKTGRNKTENAPKHNGKIKSFILMIRGMKT